MGDAVELYQHDRTRYGAPVFGAFRCRELRFLWALRNAREGRDPVTRLAAKLLHRWMAQRFGLEIPASASIGGGLYLGHAWGIAVNPDARIGRNCNLHRGVVIGQENRGSRRGTPSIGDDVWVGVNAVVVGAIKVGDDVLIAPNSYVNRDIPSHSVVLGNPCKVIAREKATEQYINSKA